MLYLNNLRTAGRKTRLAVIKIKVGILNPLLGITLSIPVAVDME
jgi:hypothetical protein